MRFFIALTAIVASNFLFSCSSSPKEKNNEEQNATITSSFHQAPEYAPMEAVWLIWPKVEHKKGLVNKAVTKSIIQALVPSVKIKLIVGNDSLKNVAKTMLPDSLFTKGYVELFNFDYNEFWARDFGPAFLINDNGEKAMADFMFNDWGYSDTADAYARKDEKLDENIAAYYKIPVLSTNIVCEGGDHDVNSEGVMILCETVEKQRNPSMSLQQIEDEYKRVLGVKKFLWMKEGVRDDDMSTYGAIAGPGNKKYYTVLTTGGHIDEYARFVNDSTIILAWVDSADRTSPVEVATGKRMEINYEILKNAVNADGRHFNIIKMPMPYLVTGTMQPGDGVYDVLSTFTYKDGLSFPEGKQINVVAAASYCNFLIANDKVLVAKYYKPGMDIKIKNRDEEAVHILQNAFPGKTVVPIDALAVNFGGGGMHCITINEPKGK